MNREKAIDSIKTLLVWLGEDVERDGLKDTPERVLRAFEEYCKGYKQNPKECLEKVFNEEYSDTIILKNINFESLCEHHLARFIGVAHIAYIPFKNVVGISKLARLVDIYANRLQLQERLTNEIAKAINVELSPQGVAVMIEAEHHCLSTRGVRKKDAKMITFASFGKLDRNVFN